MVVALLGFDVSLVADAWGSSDICHIVTRTDGSLHQQMGDLQQHL
jgi:hypothetical protein